MKKAEAGPWNRVRESKTESQKQNEARPRERSRGRAFCPMKDEKLHLIRYSVETK